MTTQRKIASEGARHKQKMQRLDHAMRSLPQKFLLAAAVALVSVAALGCNSEQVCKSDVTAGEATYHGEARGKPGDKTVREASIKDACRQMCASTKAELIDGCVARCAVDAIAINGGGASGAWGRGSSSSTRVSVRRDRTRSRSPCGMTSGSTCVRTAEQHNYAVPAGRDRERSGPHAGQAGQDLSEHD